MGLTYALVNVLGSKGGKELRLLVDTGSTFTWIRRRSLEEIGVQTLGQRNFRTIEGREVRREIGEAIIEFLGEHATRIVVFGEASDAEVLGADSLEGLGIEVDPVSRQLRKIEAFVAYSTASCSA